MHEFEWTSSLAKFSPNFTDLAISLFIGYVRLTVSIFGKAKKSISIEVPICLFYFDEWRLNILEPKRVAFGLKTRCRRRLDPTNEEVKMSRAHKGKH